MFAGAAVLSFVGGVDFADLADDLRGASWGWIIAAAIVAQLPRVTQAISTLGATPVQLPFGPVYGLQLAMSYMNLALPSSIARLAVSVRFFQRQGVAPAIAITSGAIDSFTNTIVQVLLLVLLLIFSSATVNLDLGEPSSPDVSHLLFVLLGIALVVIVTVLLLPPGRRASRRRASASRCGGRRFVERCPRCAARTGSPSSSSATSTEILFATALGMFARGLGYPLSLVGPARDQLERVPVCDVHPCAGGHRCRRGRFARGIDCRGMRSRPRATVILYRITTFYLPPIWGWFALTGCARIATFSRAWERQSARCCRWRSPSRPTRCPSPSTAAPRRSRPPHWR